MGEPAKARGPGRPRKVDLRQPIPAQNTNTPMAGSSAAVPDSNTNIPPSKTLTVAAAISGEERPGGATPSPSWADIVHGKSPVQADLNCNEHSKQIDALNCDSSNQIMNTHTQWIVGSSLFG
ncbi:unnamed protein product [Amaranthus hypochondriacus]